MIDSSAIKKAFINNWSNTLLLGIVWFTLNGKMNQVLVKEGIHDTKLAQLDKASSEHKDILKRINSLEVSFATHVGEAYIREEELYEKK